MTTKKISTVVNSINVVAGLDTENVTYKTPSVALKLGGSVKRCVEIAIGNALRNDNEHQQKVLERFLRLFEEDIKNVSSKALRSLKKKKWNKPNVLPLTEDIKKMNDYLTTEGECLIKEVMEMPSKDLLRRLSENTLCSITCFNRKRVGDVERMDLNVCREIKVGDVTSGILENLSMTEKQLVHCLKRIEVRGKRGRKVPILLTERTNKQIEILSKPINRKLLNIREDNMHLFALCESDNTLRGCDVLKKYAVTSKASRPDCLTSTKLRKHLATMTQLMNLKDNELDVIANFMGHDIRVHREFYRLPEDVIQLAKVSKVLLAMDRGDIRSLQDKNLGNLDVSINEEIFEESEEEDELVELGVSNDEPDRQNQGTETPTISDTKNLKFNTPNVKKRKSPPKKQKTNKNSMDQRSK